ncbi:MAG: hypothetical protein JWO46_707 [Nocardioidaceae bacterium]|nr:hypothetical protein [Nocardioidaceae bacterium]
MSLMVESASGGLGGEAIAASWGEGARAVEELQLSLGEGPGRDAFATHRPVMVPDLAQRSGRWPAYAAAAGEAGVRSAFVFPLVVGALRLGVLSLYSSHPRTLGPDEVADSLVLREVAVRYLLDHQDDVDAADETPLLLELDFRDAIYQAQGMVMVTLGVSLADALARMRAHAYAEELDLNDLAEDIVAGKTDLSGARDDG